MTTIDRKRAFTVPQSLFKYPEAVVHCRGLSHDKKVTVLRNLKRELVQLQRTEEESLLDGRGSSDTGSRLAPVPQAMIAFGQKSRP